MIVEELNWTLEWPTTISLQVDIEKSARQVKLKKLLQQDNEPKEWEKFV